MAKTLNTGDALYASLSHLFMVDDDNTIKELKAGLTCTPHANVLLPGGGATSSPVGRSFRTGGSGTTVYGVDFPNYVVSNAADLTVFVAVNQYNSFGNPSGAAYGTPLFGCDSAGLKVGPQIFLDGATGKAFHHNNNLVSAIASTLNTADDITSGVTSFGFTRTAAGVVKFFINGVVDSNYTGGVANTGSQFGAAWPTAEISLIGGYPGSSWASFDFAYVCDFLGTIVSEAEMLRLHNSLTGSDAFALVDLGADVTAPVLSSPGGTGGSAVCTGTVTTDEANGSLYAVVTASATGPTAAQVKLGQDHTGSAALRVVSAQAVTATGAQAIASGAVTAGTRYWHFMHEDAATNQSTVSSSASFTVTAGDAVAPVLTGSITINTGSETTTGWQASWPAATDNVAVDSYDISTDGGATWPTNWPVNNFTFTGYSPGTTYALRVRARDAAGNVSTPSISGSVTTLLPTITTDPLEDENGAILASTLIPKVGAVKLIDMSMTATWVNQTTDASGVLTLEHASLTAVTHLIVTSSTTGAAAGAKAYTPVV